MFRKLRETNNYYVKAQIVNLSKSYNLNRDKKYNIQKKLYTSFLLQFDICIVYVHVQYNSHAYF